MVLVAFVITYPMKNASTISGMVIPICGFSLFIVVLFCFYGVCNFYGYFSVEFF